MKTRIDFVSNSSSCSFIVALRKDALLEDFINEACEGCLSHADEDDNSIFVNRQNELNDAVLNYHLRASELMYLGSLDIGHMQYAYAKDDAFFHRFKDDIANNTLSSNQHIVENTDEKIVVEYDDHELIDGMAISSHKMSYVTGEYHWDDNYTCDIEKQKKAAKAIFEFAKNYADSKTDYKCRYNSNTYFISRNTIWNTRALIAAGYNVELKDWMDLDKLDKILQDGDKIFGIRVNNGGDGVDDDALFTFGGWDGEDVFEDMNGVEVLNVETM